MLHLVATFLLVYFGSFPVFVTLVAPARRINDTVDSISGMLWSALPQRLLLAAVAAFFVGTM